MNLDSLREKLASWTLMNAPTGFEEPVLTAARDALAPLCDSMMVDVRGNLYAEINGVDSAAPRVMITAHADEIGFMVTSLTNEGFLRFTRLGGPTVSVLPGQRVRLLPEGKPPVEAVIGVKPGHILTGDEAYRVPPVEQMYLDAGAESAQQLTEWGLEPGTPGVFVGELVPTSHPSRVFGKSIDNRAGWLAVLEIAERLSKDRPAGDCVIVLTVEEEIGLRGAAVAAMEAAPDVVIALDTVPSGGTPELSDEELPWTIGAGPLLKVRETSGLSTHGPLRSLFRKTAEEHDIPYQLIIDTAGITDATSAQQASGEIAAVTLGLARRYSHSAVEMLDLRDLAQLIDWTEKTTRKLIDKKQLQRI
ncbi:MAG: M20/M25/M40 family metallo-hydrolase [Planctomycetaceae bacterium]|nr:M20/M25/M40 family metallo-hydrolase [Planctomycetaceae bacterium]